MNTPDFNIVIPARFNSSRFPGKPLQALNGMPMILHVIQRARESSASKIVVATDNDKIATVCEQEGVQTEMTDINHPSGTDRIAEVVARLEWPDNAIIVGLQGDEPATPAVHLDLLATNLSKNPNADMATLCTEISSRHDYTNAHRVKVVRDANHMALYFSRAAIPARRDAISTSDDLSPSFPRAYLHIGLYAYRCNFLARYAQLLVCALEEEEQLEQLRVLYHGGSIHVGEIDHAPAHGVDHKDDIAAVEAALLVQQKIS